MRDDTTPICPLPGLGHCVRERCNFWDEEKEECASDCLEAHNPMEAASELDPGMSCVIFCYEDYD
jgi:hypothetical protein